MNFVDLDGVICEMHHLFQYNRDPRQVLRHMVTHCETIFRDLEPCEKAIRYVKEHFKGGFKILTSTPSPAYFPKDMNIKRIEYARDVWKQTKLEWVRKYVGDVVVLFSSGFIQKYKFIENPGDILVDDSELELLAWRRNGGVPILAFNYNKKLKTPKDLFSLKEDFC